MRLPVEPESRLWLTIQTTNKRKKKVSRLYCLALISESPIVWRLQQGNGSCYDVSMSETGAECTCPDYIYDRHQKDRKGCKHIKSLTDQGLLPGNSRSCANAQSEGSRSQYQR